MYSCFISSQNLLGKILPNKSTNVYQTTNDGSSGGHKEINYSNKKCIYTRIIINKIYICQNVTLINN